MLTSAPDKKPNIRGIFTSTFIWWDINSAVTNYTLRQKWHPLPKSISVPSDESSGSIDVIYWVGMIDGFVFIWAEVYLKEMMKSE